jgi:hypothetical protein
MDHPNRSLIMPTCKYQPGQILKHYKGQEYVIVTTPDLHHVKLEATGEWGYGYAKPGQPIGDENPLWQRSQAEIEDETRFSPVPK